MPIETDSDLAVFFNAEEFGLAATYVAPNGGDAMPCVVHLSEIDRDRPEFAGRVPLSGKIVTVLAADIPQPLSKGRFLVGAASFVITGEPYLELPGQKVWSCVVA